MLVYITMLGQDSQNMSENYSLPSEFIGRRVEEEILPIVINSAIMSQILGTATNIVNKFGSGPRDESGYDLPIVQIAVLPFVHHQIQEVPAGALPFAKFEIPIGDFKKRAEWNAQILFNFGNPDLTNDVLVLKDGSVKVRRYNGSPVEYLDDETAEGLAQDLEAFLYELEQEHQNLLGAAA